MLGFLAGDAVAKMASEWAKQVAAGTVRDASLVATAGSGISSAAIAGTTAAFLGPMVIVGYNYLEKQDELSRQDVFVPCGGQEKKSPMLPWPARSPARFWNPNFIKAPDSAMRKSLLTIINQADGASEPAASAAPVDLPDAATATQAAPVLRGKDLHRMFARFIMESSAVAHGIVDSILAVIKQELKKLEKAKADIRRKIEVAIETNDKSAYTKACEEHKDIKQKMEWFEDLKLNLSVTMDLVRSLPYASIVSLPAIGTLEEVILKLLQKIVYQQESAPPEEFALSFGEGYVIDASQRHSWGLFLGKIIFLLEQHGKPAPFSVQQDNILKPLPPVDMTLFLRSLSAPAPQPQVAQEVVETNWDVVQSQVKKRNALPPRRKHQLSDHQKIGFGTKRRN